MTLEFHQELGHGTHHIQFDVTAAQFHQTHRLTLVFPPMIASGASPSNMLLAKPIHVLHLGYLPTICQKFCHQPLTHFSFAPLRSQKVLLAPLMLHEFFLINQQSLQSFPVETPSLVRHVP